MTVVNGGSGGGFVNRSPANAWLTKGRNPEARVRLFCLPHAGAGAAGYHGWKRLLPAAIEVCPVQIPGRENRLSEPPYLDSEALIEETALAMAGSLDLPYAIFGHSMGRCSRPTSTVNERRWDVPSRPSRVWKTGTSPKRDCWHGASTPRGHSRAGGSRATTFISRESAAASCWS